MGDIDAGKGRLLTSVGRRVEGRVVQTGEGYAARFQRQQAFHDKILETAGNQLIRETLWHQHTHFHIFRLMFHARVTDEALDEHANIMAAFEARDPGAAENAMRIHIERSRSRLSQVFE